MGWKSTIEITREKAIKLLEERLKYWHISNNTLACLLENAGYGEDENLPYYGHNFIIVDDERTEYEKD